MTPERILSVLYGNIGPARTRLLPIAPEHLLDLRARVRLRHALVDQRGEWQQRIHAVLYHHGHPQKAGLLTAANRAWLERLALPDAAREQVTVALVMIDALDAQSAAITAQLRRYARRQAGCRALMGLYGVGELTAVAILAELGDTRRFSSSRQAVRYVNGEFSVAGATSVWVPLERGEEENSPFTASPLAGLRIAALALLGAPAQAIWSAQELATTSFPAAAVTTACSATRATTRWGQP